jgi:hypothetical protein
MFPDVKNCCTRHTDVWRVGELSAAGRLWIAVQLVFVLVCSRLGESELQTACEQVTTASVEPVSRGLVE